MTVQLPDEAIQKWAQEQIGMIAVHRAPRKFEESDGKHRLTLEDGTDHPLGQRLNLHGDGMQSFYRIKDDRITQINRKMPHVAFTINVEESSTDARSQTFDHEIHRLLFCPAGWKAPQRRKLYRHPRAHRLLGSPATRRIISYENGEVMVRTMTFKNHKLLA